MWSNALTSSALITMELPDVQRCAKNPHLHALTLLMTLLLHRLKLQGDSLKRGPKYSVVTPHRMKQSEPKNMLHTLTYV